MVKSVTPEKVSARMIEAIEKNKAEVLVTRGLAKIVDVTHAISPDFTTKVARSGGTYKFLRQATERDHRE
jgi:hypothetical protein